MNPFEKANYSGVLILQPCILQEPWYLDFRFETGRFGKNLAEEIPQELQEIGERNAVEG